MWLEGGYPAKEGVIAMRMGHIATSEANICSITGSIPVYVVKCGDKYYHKYHRVGLDNDGYSEHSGVSLNALSRITQSLGCISRQVSWT